jgi:hypothetical protein
MPSRASGRSDNQPDYWLKCGFDTGSIAPAIAVPGLVLLVSGATALMFGTLWFRQAGLALGNTAWSGRPP